MKLLFVVSGWLANDARIDERLAVTHSFSSYLVAALRLL